MVAEHSRPRKPGELPKEGVAMVGVDLDQQSLYRTVAARLGLETAGAAYHGAPTAGAPTLSPLIVPAAAVPAQGPNIEPLPCRDATASATLLGAPPVGAPVVNETPFDLNALAFSRNKPAYKVIPSVLAQDALLPNEEKLLEHLYRHGKTISTAARLYRNAGERTIAKELDLQYFSVQTLLRTLRDKFCLEICNPGKNRPKLFLVYSWQAILEHRRKSGYTFYIRKNGGRILVSASGDPAPLRPDLDLDELQRLIDRLTIGVANTGAPRPGALTVGAKPTTIGTPMVGAVYRNSNIPTEKHSTTTTAGAPTVILDALYNKTNHTDTNAALKIFQQARNRNASVAVEEIARLIHDLPIPPSIENPTGLLIVRIPDCCDPDSLTNYRKRWAAIDEAEQRQILQKREENLRTATAILTDSAEYPPGSKWHGWALHVQTHGGEEPVGASCPSGMKI
jgi:hypothetical protein